MTLFRRFFVKRRFKNWFLDQVILPHASVNTSISCITDMFIVEHLLLLSLMGLLISGITHVRLVSPYMNIQLTFFNRARITRIFPNAATREKIKFNTYNEGRLNESLSAGCGKLTVVCCTRVMETYKQPRRTRHNRISDFLELDL